MSKSLGNIFQLSEALDRYGREAVVAYLISGHYRQPLEFSEQALDEAAARVERIRNFVLELPEETSGGRGRVRRRPREALLDALADDFNTPRALAALFELVAEGNRRPLAGARAALARCCRCSGSSRCWRQAEVPDPEAERVDGGARAGPRRRGLPGGPTRSATSSASRGYEVRDTEGPAGARG